MIPEDIQTAFHNRFPSGITTIDSHTAGEYTRLVIHGITRISGRTMAEKRQFFIDHLDTQRLLLTREPRGNRDVVAAVLTEPVTAGSSFGLIYMDALRYPYLCGHATIGAVTSLVETGLVTVQTDKNNSARIVVDTPSGPMPVRTEIKENRVISVTFLSVPCFFFAGDILLDISAEVQVSVDIVCAGGFFAMVDLDQPFFQGRRPGNRELINLGMAITRKACMELKVSHPLRPEVCSIDVTEFYRQRPNHQGESLVIYGESHMDRSPCGTGTAAKMALLHHKGLIRAGIPYYNKGPLDTCFRAVITEEVLMEGYTAVKVAITGSASITGLHQFVLDAGDPFPRGFLL